MAKTTPLLHQPLGHDPSSASILVGSDLPAASYGDQVRRRLSAGGRWIRTIGPRKDRFLLRKANCGTERGQPKRVVSYTVPMVRIHLPPAGSLSHRCLPTPPPHQTGVATVTAGQREIAEHPWHALIEHRAVVAAGFLAECAGQPTFADAGRTFDDQVLRFVDPAAGDHPAKSG